MKKLTIYPIPKFQYLTNLLPILAIRHVFKPIAFTSFPQQPTYLVGRFHPFTGHEGP